MHEREWEELALSDLSSEKVTAHVQSLYYKKYNNNNNKYED